MIIIIVINVSLTEKHCAPGPEVGQHGAEQGNQAGDSDQLLSGQTPGVGVRPAEGPEGQPCLHQS